MTHKKVSRRNFIKKRR